MPSISSDSVSTLKIFKALQSNCFSGRVTISSRVNGASADEMVHSGSIPGWVKPKT